MYHFRFLIPLLILIFPGAFTISGQAVVRPLSAAAGQTVEVTNRFGRIDVVTGPADASLTITPVSPIAENEVKIEASGGTIRITVVPANSTNRIDLVLNLPERTKLRLTTREGEIKAEGNFDTINAESDTGTIAVDVPEESIRYELLWTASRPRFVADFELERVRERAGGRFTIKGRHSEQSSTASEIPRDVSLKLTTQRGIVLINVPPNEVTGDLRERELTDAAKAIIRSGDTVMMDAIRRAAPTYFGNYVSTLPPVWRSPGLSVAQASPGLAAGGLKRATVTVTDVQNRAVSGLSSANFEVFEDNRPREIVSVRPVQAPVNLVLLLDVSGSIDNYVNFIRKAAREFVETVDERDRVSIVLFNEDVKVLADFSTDKRMLSESLDTFDAGGATAYYDALGYAISESLRPLKGERTAIVVLTDGDDNRSFLAFDSLIGAIEESGALVYPLYVPSSLIAASAASGFGDIDPLRNRHLTLTSKANDEGARLAKVSGGVYYPISQLSQINTAYEDIVLQLRTAYDVTYRSELPDGGSNRGAGPRLRIRVDRPNSFVQMGPVIRVEGR